MWGFASVIQAIANEVRGWRKFHQTTGVFPYFSAVNSVLSIPLLFAAGIYCWVATANRTHHLLPIYAALFGSVISAAAIWYGVRRLANQLDTRRALSRRRALRVDQDVERYIR